MPIDVRMKVNLSDKRTVLRLIRYIDKGVYKSLHQSCEYIKKTSRTTLGRGRKTAKAKNSLPGQPPNRHTKIKAGFGFQAHSVVMSLSESKREGIVGPIKFRDRRKSSPRSMNVNEFGGRQVIRVLPVSRDKRIINPDGTAKPKKNTGKGSKYHSLSDSQKRYARDKSRKNRRKLKVHSFRYSVHAPAHAVKYEKRPFQEPALKKVIASRKILVIFQQNVLGRKFMKSNPQPT